MAAKAYRVLVGLTYPNAGTDKRAEPGDVVSDLPEKSIPWLVADGYIEPVETQLVGEHGPELLMPKGKR